MESVKLVLHVVTPHPKNPTVELVEAASQSLGLFVDDSYHRLKIRALYDMKDDGFDFFGNL